LFKEFKINSYFDKKTSINEPLIPGRIIADIAMAPERKIKKLEFGLDEGANSEMEPDTKSPNSNHM
tara:strand:+ start:328 stop:525 length:198 start_codon:yes stop_codon:yes gene_type:complete